MTARSFRSLGSTFGIVIISRIVGVFRDLLISIFFGFSRYTDLFFQSTFVPTYILNILCGPFTTAFMAAFNEAPVEHRDEILLHYRVKSVLIGSLISIIFLCGGWVAVFMLSPPHLEDYLTVVAILSPSCAAFVVLGYASAGANGKGMIARSSALLFFYNALFVVLVLLAGLARFRPATWILPTIFTVASIGSVLPAWRYISNATSEKSPTHVRENRRRENRRLPTLLPNFILAGSESGAFIITQFVVLSMASHAGVGWASAASLAQRICLSSLGLVITPVSNSIMLSIMVNKQKASETFGRSAFGALIVLGAGAIFLSVFGVWLLQHVQMKGRFSAANAHLLASLVPSFALWLVPMGLNAIIGKAMFALGMSKLYIRSTLVSYLIANIGRVWLGLANHFTAAIALGALVELIVALLLATYSYFRISEGGPTPAQ